MLDSRPAYLGEPPTLKGGNQYPKIIVGIKPKEATCLSTIEATQRLRIASDNLSPKRNLPPDAIQRERRMKRRNADGYRYCKKRIVKSSDGPFENG